MLENDTLWGGTHLYGLSISEYPLPHPHPSGVTAIYTKQSTGLKRAWHDRLTVRVRFFLFSDVPIWKNAAKINPVVVTMVHIIWKKEQDTAVNVFDQDPVLKPDLNNPGLANWILPDFVQLWRLQCKWFGGEFVSYLGTDC